MAYMIMLTVEDAEQLKAVVKAWERLHVEDVVLIDGTRFQRTGTHRPHIAMRFMFEQLERARQPCAVLLGVVSDEATVQQCVVQAESVLGDLDTAENAVLVAWPLSIVKGLPQHPRSPREDAA